MANYNLFRMLRICGKYLIVVQKVKLWFKSNSYWLIEITVTFIKFSSKENAAIITIQFALVRLTFWGLGKMKKGESYIQFC